MKILVLQLARLGDIYQTWPVIRALRRRFPEAQIDLVVRKKYREATVGLEQANRVLAIDSAEILRPMMQDSPMAADANLRLRRWLFPLRANRYDQVINLSFSPLSSYLTHFVSHEETEIRGYSRFDDGFLQVGDRSSRYFYGQVGIGRDNRKHLVDVFAEVAGVSLISDDFSAPQVSLGGQVGFHPKQSPYLVVHLAASEQEKCYGVHRWQSVVAGVLKNTSHRIVLIGSQGERELSDQLELFCESPRLLNLVARTSVSDLFPIIQGASLVVGGDSAPMHVASLTGTRCLNLSFASTNFWETGPRAIGSRVLWQERPEDLASDRVAEEIRLLLMEEPAQGPVLETCEGTPSYQNCGYEDEDFGWQMVRALYGYGGFPALTHENQAQALHQISEVNEIALQQLDQLSKDPSDRTAGAILDRVDELLAAIAQSEPSFGPMVRWYQAEKSNIGPGPIQELVHWSREVHDKMKEFVHQLMVTENSSESLDDAELKGGTRAS